MLGVCVCDWYNYVCTWCACLVYVCVLVCIPGTCLYLVYVCVCACPVHVCVCLVHVCVWCAWLVYVCLPDVCAHTYIIIC